MTSKVTKQMIKAAAVSQVPCWRRWATSLAVRSFSMTKNSLIGCMIAALASK